MSLFRFSNNRQLPQFQFKMRSLLLGLAAAVTAKNLGLSDDTLQSIDAQLSKECGAECISMWHGMLTQTKDQF